MANEQNLIYFTSEQSREEAERNGRKGGIASGVARRRKRDLKEAADFYMSLPVMDGRVRNKILRAGVPLEDIDYQMSMIVGLANKASKGDAKAAKLLIDLLSANGDTATDAPDDGFVDALKGEAAEVWQED